jgi:hypothetical protein
MTRALSAALLTAGAAVLCVGVGLCVAALVLHPAAIDEVMR